MNVSMEKTSPVSARLTVKVEENDYKEKVKKELKEFGRTHAIPGFRKGHIPASELNRRFGRQMTSDVINHEVYEAVIKFLQENKLNVLGEPLPVEVKSIEPGQPEYTFEYDLALEPELDIVLDKRVKLPYYIIEVTDQMIDERDKMFRRRFGEQVKGDAFEEDALVKGSIMELDADGNVKETEDAIQVINGIVMPQYFSDKDEAARFNGSKVGDKVVFNPAKASGENVAELASMLNIDKDRAAEVKSDFVMAISEFVVVRPAQLGEAFYTDAFGKDRVHDEKEYREAIKGMIDYDLYPNSEQMFQRDFTEYMMDKYGKNMELPAELLKKWLITRNEDITEENVDEQYNLMSQGLKWQIIKEKIASMVDLKVTEEDLEDYAKVMARQQFAQYGMTNVDDETLADYAKRMLADKNYRQNIAQRVSDFKLYDLVKGHITLKNEEVTLDRFKELAENPKK